MEALAHAHDMQQTDHATVLLAEDNPALRKVIKTNLVHAGYAVVLAGDGIEALEKIHAVHPDLIVLDWVMPRMQGSDVCEKVKGDPEVADTPVIMLTGKSAQRDIEQGFELGADEYITKPFEVDELVGVIRRLMGGTAGW